jgi:hypothetical protein
MKTTQRSERPPLPTLTIHPWMIEALSPPALPQMSRPIWLAELAVGNGDQG